MAKKLISGIIIAILLNYVVISYAKRPIIGIVAQEFPNGFQSTFEPATTYIAASYVKAVESSGARVVPILTHQPESYYRWILKSINGVVLPGGSTKLAKGHRYYDTMTTIYKIAEEMNDKGIQFPIVGICLGFEALAIITNNHKDLRSRCKVIHENYPLKFQPRYKESLQFSNIAGETEVFMKHFPTTHHNHRWCVTPYNFTRSLLSSQWNIITTSTSTRGVEFISTMEHKKYPFVGIQFHPEKIMFEWNPEYSIPHNRAAIQVNRHFYDLLVYLSKNNHNHFENEIVEHEHLIYKFTPIDTIESLPPFVQIYTFQ